MTAWVDWTDLEARAIAAFTRPSGKSQIIAAMAEHERRLYPLRTYTGNRAARRKAMALDRKVRS